MAVSNAILVAIFGPQDHDRYVLAGKGYCDDLRTCVTQAVGLYQVADVLVSSVIYETKSRLTTIGPLNKYHTRLQNPSLLPSIGC